MIEFQFHFHLIERLRHEMTFCRDRKLRKLNTIVLDEAYEFDDMKLNTLNLFDFI